jgi:hypothetical protein
MLTMLKSTVAMNTPKPTPVMAKPGLAQLGPCGAVWGGIWGRMPILSRVILGPPPEGRRGEP